jgi:hypothetical protein
MCTGHQRRISVLRNPRWQNSAIRDVTAAKLPANNIELHTDDPYSVISSVDGVDEADVFVGVIIIWTSCIT